MRVELPEERVASLDAFIHLKREIGDFPYFLLNYLIFCDDSFTFSSFFAGKMLFISFFFCGRQPQPHDFFFSAMCITSFSVKCFCTNLITAAKKNNLITPEVQQVISRKGSSFFGTPLTLPWGLDCSRPGCRHPKKSNPFPMRFDKLRIEGNQEN